MTMQSVSLSALEASAANPRRKFDRETVEGLAASIRTDGLLHNLVVSPVKGKGKKERYQIVSGSRRFEALRLLEDAYRVLEVQARQFTGKLGFIAMEGESVWTAFPPRGTNDLALYEAVRGLSDHDLSGLQTLLAALSFGQADCDRLDTRDSLFNRVARDLGVDMRSHWRPDAAFLSKRTREQLVGIARACGYAEGIGLVGGYKKSELVACLVRHFQTAQTTSEPTAAQQKARNWSPEAMLFPAVDPNAPSAQEDEEVEDIEVE